MTKTRLAHRPDGGSCGHDHGHDHDHAHGHDCGHDHHHGQHHHATAAAPATCGSCCGAPVAGAGALPASGVRLRFRVRGLDCAEEVRLLERAVGPLVGGREHLAFDVLHGRMAVLESASPVTVEAILKAVREVGLDAEVDRGGRTLEDAIPRHQVWLTAASGGFWIAGILWHLATTGFFATLNLLAGHADATIPAPEWGLFLLSVLTGLVLLAPRAWNALRSWRPDMYLLVTVAAVGAIVIDELFEAAAVVFLFALSLLLERWSVDRARRAIEALLDLAPPTARLVGPDGEREVPAESVAPGSRIRVLAGERIPLDGVVRAGRSAVDQAPITGESMPVEKGPGDPVYAGTILVEGTLELETTRPASDTVLARIVRMVEEARTRRTTSERWVDRFARIYTPAVMVAALLLFIVPVAAGAPVEPWLYRALVLLVVACPCALVISTPVSVVSALAASARHGVLVKGGTHLETAARIQAVAFDKTGTLTLGRPTLVAVVPAPGVSEDELLATAGALEAQSVHPLARAIVAGVKERGVAIPEAREVITIPGRGLEGRLGEAVAWLGSPRFAAERGANLGPLEAELARLEDEGRTVVVVGAGDRVLGLLGLFDVPRPEARAALAALHRLGVARLVMLTGDHRRTAEALARELGLDEVRAELLPEDKVTAVRTLARERAPVAMVGDGVNDAPAMAEAQLAVAMGAIGTDVAIETADVALMTDRLDRLPWLVAHGRRMLATIRTNVAFALGVKAVFVALALLGYAVLWLAVAADVGATLVVVAWALRLLAVREEPVETAALSTARAAA